MFFLFAISSKSIREYLETVDYILIVATMISIPVFVLAVRWSLYYDFSARKVEEKEIEVRPKAIEESKPRQLPARKVEEKHQNPIIDKLLNELKKQNKEYITVDEYSLYSQRMGISKLNLSNAIDRFGFEILLQETPNSNKLSVGYVFDKNLVGKYSPSPTEPEMAYNPL